MSVCRAESLARPPGTDVLQQPERRPTPTRHDRRRPPRPKLRAAASVTPTGPAPRLPPQKPHARPARRMGGRGEPAGPKSDTASVFPLHPRANSQTRLPLTATASPSAVPHVQPQDGSARPPLCKTTAHARLCSWGFVRALAGGGCRAEGVCGRVTGPVLAAGRSSQGPASPPPLADNARDRATLRLKREQDSKYQEVEF